MAKRILLIDDDLDDAELFEEALAEVDESALFEHIDGCRDGLDRLLTMQVTTPDVIFLDINMPSLSGWECLAELRNHPSLNHIPVIMYSTSSYEQEWERASQRGANAFMTKPHSFKEMQTKLRDYLRMF